MRKTILVLSVVVFVFTFSVVSVGAQAAPDVTALADELPSENAVVFASIRTDDAFIDALDAVLAPFYPYAEDLPEGFSLRDGIDMTLADEGFDGTFEEDIRPWLGDSVALAAYVDTSYYEDTEFLYTDDVFDNLEVIGVVDIADRAAAEAFIAGVFEAEDANIEAQERSGYTYYEIPFGPVLALDDDTLIIAEEAMFSTYSLLSGDFASLGSSADFNETLRSMPAPSYSGVGYANMPVIQSVIETVAETSEDEFGQADAEESLVFLETFGIGSLAVGLTGFGDSTIAIDGLAINGAGYLGGVDLGAISPNFASRIPASTPLVIHGTNIRGSFEATLNTLLEIDDESTDAEEITEGLDEINQALESETGLVLEDVFGWMTNDYALILRLSDTALNANSIFGLLGANPLDLGLLIDASENPEAAVALVDAIEDGATGELAAEITEGEDADVDLELTREADVLTLSLRDNTGEVPFPIELQVGVADDVFFVGTPGVASSIIAGDGGLASTSNFVEASTLMLPGTLGAYYIDVNNLLPLVDIAESFAEEEDMEDINTLREVLSLFKHLTLSQAIDNDGNTFARATITFSN